MAKVTIQLARAAKRRAVELLCDLPGVVGIGVCRTPRGGYGVKVNLERVPPRSGRGSVPKSIAGVPVAVEVVGRIKPR